MKKLLAAIVILAHTFYSCGPAATFDKPQPDNVKSLTSFPDWLQGSYFASDNASVVTITDKRIIRHYDFDYKQHKDSLGSSYNLVGDTIIDVTNNTKEKVLLKGDTVMLHADWIDTLFEISPANVLKKFKGYYFLNNQYSNNVWEVKKLSLKKGILTMGSISYQEDILKLEEITETKEDTASTHFSLTQRQFKKFVKKEGFDVHETFTRMAENAK